MKVNPDVVLMVGPYAPISEFVKQAKKNNFAARVDDLVATVGHGIERSHFSINDADGM
jgi:hypothetical protein